MVPGFGAPGAEVAVQLVLNVVGMFQVGVYRMSGEHIGCSLAEAAQTPAYLQFLQTASTTKPSLHVIYINTSLETKAQAHSLVPTITCTSSNVVQTVLQVSTLRSLIVSKGLCSKSVAPLWSFQGFSRGPCQSRSLLFLGGQAFSQVPGLTVWYGPDSYMGANLAELFRIFCTMSDEEIAAVHPAHNRQTVSDLLSRLHHFQVGHGRLRCTIPYADVSHARCVTTFCCNKSCRKEHVWCMTCSGKMWWHA